MQYVDQEWEGPTGEVTKEGEEDTCIDTLCRRDGMAVLPAADQMHDPEEDGLYNRYRQFI